MVKRSTLILILRAHFISKVQNMGISGEEIHPDFETQGRLHQKSKTRASGVKRSTLILILRTDFIKSPKQGYQRASVVKRSTLILILRADFIKSPKQGYQRASVVKRSTLILILRAHFISKVQNMGISGEQIHPDFETQGRLHQKSKTRVSALKSSTLILILRADLTRSPKQKYQWPMVFSILYHLQKLVVYTYVVCERLL